VLAEVRKEIFIMEEKPAWNENETRNAEKDRMVGGTTQAKGRVKESWGVLTDNERLQAEGRREQRAGGMRSKKGQWKERIKAWIDRL
jgi:uncharacterized protein YjbJ (UPF0337 family)